MNKHKNNDTPDNPPEESSAWNEYARFHDRFIEQLSYDRPESCYKANIWEYCYL